MSTPQINRTPVNPIKAPEGSPDWAIELVRQINTELARIWTELTKLDKRVTDLEP